MPRKKVQRGLPQLPKLRALRNDEHKAARLTEVLRRIAIANRTESPQTFYSLREVADHFAVPLSTASRAYSLLEKDSLLCRLRGSKTILAGSVSGRQLTVRGVIGMPASLSCLVASQDYRTFFLRARRELRMRGFVTEVTYFEKRELWNGELSGRLKRYQVDTVLWYLPETAAHETIGSLQDAGVSVIGISDGGLATINSRYEVRRNAATRQLLRTWRTSAAIEKVSVLSAPDRGSAADGERLQALLEQEGWQFEFVNLTSFKTEALLALPVWNDSSGLLLLSSAASVLSFRTPDLLIALLGKRRVALLDGPIGIPFGSFPPEARVDLIYVDWQHVAEHLANDLMRPSADRTDAPAVFEAEARPQVVAADYAQTI
jgi:hypothetical protein